MRVRTRLVTHGHLVPSRRPRMEPFQAFCKHFTPNAKSVLYSVQAVHRMIEMFDISTGCGTAAHQQRVGVFDRSEIQCVQKRY